MPEQIRVSKTGVLTEIDSSFAAVSKTGVLVEIYIVRQHVSTFGVLVEISIPFSEGPYIGATAFLDVDIASTFTPVVQIVDLAGLLLTTGLVDTSTRASRARTFTPAVYDNGELSFDVMYDPDEDTHSASVAGGIVRMLMNGEAANYRLRFVDRLPTTVATFAGFLTDFAPKALLDGALHADLTIKIKGAVTWHVVS